MSRAKDFCAKALIFIKWGQELEAGRAKWRQGAALLALELDEIACDEPLFRAAADELMAAVAKANGGTLV